MQTILNSFCLNIKNEFSAKKIKFASGSVC